MIKILSNEDASSIRTEQILPNAYALVNELVRNSIDAHSTEIVIRIDVINKSIVYIVEDNGEGIGINEYFLQKGATSKGSSTTSDRCNYGYKGMALHSLISVADFTITTKHNEDTARIEVREREVKINKTDYHKENSGTTIRVENYYRGKPIRYNYLYSTLSKDINSIIDAIQKYTVVHMVQFKCYKNSKLIYSTPYSLMTTLGREKTFSRPERVRLIYGIDTHTTIIFNGRSMTLEYIVKEGKGVEGVIHTEKAVVDNAKIDKQIKSSVKLDKKVYYNLAINSIEYREIALIKEIEIAGRYNIKNLLETDKKIQIHTIDISPMQDLAEKHIAYKNVQRSSIEESMANENTSSQNRCLERNATTSQSYTGSYSSSSKSILAQYKEQPKENEISGRIEAIIIDKNEEILKYAHTGAIGLNIKDIAELRIIGQFNNGFILCTSEKSTGAHIYAVDQHSADEAVNYEQLKKEYDYKRQRLIKPMKIGVNKYHAHIIEENLEEIERHGFILSKEHNEIWEAPFYNDTVFGENELIEIVEEIKEGRIGKGKDRIIFKSLRKILANKACRASIMIGEPLTMQRMKEIIRDLSLTTRPWNCPHGRPTILLLHSPR